MYIFKESLAIEKDIKNINNKDNKVKILGTVISKINKNLIIDDKTGTINVTSTDDINNIFEGQIVRIFGRVANDTLFAEIIQDMTKLDIELYKKAKVKWEGIW
ncbi:MAG: hypothetical protein K0B02_02285 [DPANN group archaeon]|nr:hypothetical protein [DPANN group archaeon]